MVPHTQCVWSSSLQLTLLTEAALSVLSRQNLASIYPQPSDPLFLRSAIAVSGAGWPGGWVGSWYIT